VSITRSVTDTVLYGFQIRYIYWQAFIGCKYCYAFAQKFEIFLAGQEGLQICVIASSMSYSALLYTREVSIQILICDSCHITWVINHSVKGLTHLTVLRTSWLPTSFWCSLLMYSLKRFSAALSACCPAGDNEASCWSPNCVVGGAVAAGCTQGGV